MLSVKYLKAVILNTEAKLGPNKRLPMRCDTPSSSEYYPAEDTNLELDSNELQYFQDMIGVLRWDIEIERVDILLEVDLLSIQLVFPREGRIEHANHIVA